MKNTLKWRLSKLPTVDEITTLLEKKIITQNEAKEILFNNETEDSVKNEDLKSEIKFLREIIEKLSDQKTIRTTVYEYIQKYPTYPFYQPYYYWSSPILTCGNNLTLTGGSTALYTTSNSLTNLTGAASDSSNCQTATNCSFTNISTF